jgi:hypothetical protein
VNESHTVGLFPESFVKVSRISTTSPDDESQLLNIDDESTIALDLEWTTELCLFKSAPHVVY